MIRIGGQIDFIGQISHRRKESARERIPLKWEELKTFLPEELHEEIAPQEWSFQPLSHYTLRMCSDLVQLAASHGGGKSDSGL